jgi:hypothetical protein
MPVLLDWNVEIAVADVLRAQGVDPALAQARRPRVVALAEEALRVGRELIHPAVVYRQWPVAGLRHEVLSLAGGGCLRGPLIADRLSAAQEVAVVVCTIGAGLELAASEKITADPALGLALDGLGSAAVEALSNAACRYFGERALARGWQATLPLSPGLEGWSVAQGQPELFDLLDARAIGVTLTTTCLMLPRKSASFVIGLGPNVTVGGQACDFCVLRATCRYRANSAQAGK